MSKEYKVNAIVRFANRILVQLLRWGVPMSHISLLTVRGRKSGRTYSLPVELVEEGGKRWIVSPYGEVNWVKNARIAGEVTLFRAGKTETVRIHELGPQESAPILKRYITDGAITRPYFDVPFDAPLEAFVAEAPRHPVFFIS
jgi:deazaflavin-dependent oxidoreductase (nitroreductase family)